VSRRLVLLDTAFLLHRAFHATAAQADRMRDDRGRVDNAIRGLRGAVDRVRRQVAMHPVAGTVEVIAAWDCDWRPAWRVALVGSYKTHRLGDGEDSERIDPRLAEQFPRAIGALTAAGVPVLGASGCEADDVLATLAHRDRAPNRPDAVWIVTGDRDLCQVVDDAAGVGLLLLSRGGQQWVDEAGVTAMTGVAAAQYVDFAVLRGDPSDGLPGLPGVGAVTAARLLADFGDLDRLLAAAADRHTRLRERIATALLSHTAALLAARAVITLRRDAPVRSVTDDTPADSA